MATVHYDGTPSSSGAGPWYNEKDNQFYRCAVRFAASDLASYVGKKLAKVQYSMIVNREIMIMLEVYDENGLLREQSIQNPHEYWNEVTLITPIEITGKDLLIGFKMLALDSGAVTGIQYDNGPRVSGVNWEKFGDDDWTELNPGHKGNLNIRAKITQ